MSESFGIDYSADPRKVFVNYLIFLIKNIEGVLYSRDATSSIRMLKGLIDSLDKKSKEALEKQYDFLNDVEKGKWHYQNYDLEKTYREILNYLHETYLQEVSRIKPLNPKPKHIGAEDVGQSAAV